MLENNPLQQAFLKGTTPKNLEGFYKGRLLQIFPNSIVEFLGGLAAKFWLPWHGKEFYKDKQEGDNILPLYLLPFISLRYGNKVILKKDGQTIHAFPFKTTVKKGLKDDIQVMQLDYDLQGNPPTVRNVIDELVCIGKNSYLGKAHIKNANGFRTVAFFSLKTEFSKSMVSR